MSSAMLELVGRQFGQGFAEWIETLPAERQQVVIDTTIARQRAAESIRLRRTIQVDKSGLVLSVACG